MLSPAEQKLIRQATEGPGEYRAVVWLLVLTGQRREEVAGMCGSKIRPEKAV